MAGLNTTDPAKTQVDLILFNKDVPEFLHKQLPTVYHLSGFILNICLIIYFISSGKYRQPVFTLLTSLAVSDMVCCLAGAAYAGVLFPTLSITTPTAGVLCYLVFIICYGLLASGYNLVFFAILRLYQLVFPIKARVTVTCGSVAKVCLCVHLVTASYSAPFAVLFKPTQLSIAGETMTVCMFTGNSYLKDLTWNIFSTIIPCVAIFLLHISKYIAVSCSKAVSASHEQQNHRNTDIRAVFIVIILFYVTWCVPNMYMLIQHFLIKEYSFVHDRLYLVLVQVMFSNSTLNPIVYVLAAKSVRDDAINFICATKHKQGNGKWPSLS